MKNTKTLKTIVFSLGLSVLTLTATNLNAQNDGSRGLFGKGGSAADKEVSSLMRGDQSINSGDATGITNYGIGETETAPLGSGIAIMLAAGLGYAALKKKED